jgi:hypothetical protein
MSASLKLEKVNYQKFVDDLNSNQISKVDLYSLGDEVLSHSLIDFTYQTQNGVLKGVSMPLVSSDDILLVQVLEGRSIDYTTHESDYPHERVNEMGHVIGITAVVVGLPIILVSIIIYQRCIVSRLRKKIVSLES